MAAYQSYDIPVRGGNVHVGHWGNKGPVVFAIHGITATHISWLSLADEISEQYQLIAIDLRGRGKSANVIGPWGLAEHVSDVIAVLDYLDIAQVEVLLGHSMGAFVSAILGAEHADRFKQIIFLDGGIPVLEELPEGVTAEQLVQAILGPSIARLEMTFESPQAYLDFWKEHPAFADEWSKYIEEYALYDLVGEAPALRSGVNKQAIIGDVESQVTDDLLQRSLKKLQHPIRFIRAEFGIQGPEPLYSQKIVDNFIEQYTGSASCCTFNGRNHFTALVSPTGAGMLAAELKTLLGNIE
jgi:pimeloyl-ACP methyl ester carboxylesterase